MNEKLGQQEEPDTLSIPQLAKRLGLSEAKAYELAQTDEYPFPIIRIGGRVMVSRKAYEDWLSRYDYVPEQNDGIESQEV